METKVCTKCKVPKELNEFYIRLKGSPDEYQQQCKMCLTLRSHNYYLNHKERKRETDKLWAKNNPEKFKLLRRKQSKKYYEKNKDKFKQYNNLHRNKIREYEKHQRLTNPDWKIKDNQKRRMRYALKHNIKSGTTPELLGCSFEFLRIYLESLFKPGMTWENYGYRGWHIDHIKPCSSFDLSNPEEQKKCFHYTNLQPLWAQENMEKSDKLLIALV